MQRQIFISLLFGFLCSCGRGVPQLSHSGICDGYQDWSTSAYNLPWPVNSSYTVAQGNCGPASHTGVERYAYDFDMPLRSLIAAARGGIVHKVVEQNADGNGCAGGGNYIQILHSDGTLAEYLHLTQNGAAVNVGAAVAQGDVIGLSGNSGCSSGPHLHFQVYADIHMTDTIPVTFKNTVSNRRGLIEGRRYTAQ